MPLRPGLVLLSLVLVGCGSGLADRGAFQGDVAVALGGQEWRGRLTWARPSAGSLDGTLQFDVSRDGHADNVSLVPPARMVAFRNGVPRSVTAEEQRLLAGLAAIFGWGASLGIESATRVAGRDAARFADGVEVIVTVLAERPAGPHGR